jgi:hypothetical protein
MGTTFCQCGHQRSAHNTDSCVFCPCREFTLRDRKARPSRLPLQWWEAAILHHFNHTVRPYMEDHNAQEEAHGELSLVPGPGENQGHGSQ